MVIKIIKLERLIQNQLFQILFDQRDKQGRNKYYFITPNVNLYDWESDLIFKDNRDFLRELEIKTSREDFFNDFRNKKKKHKMLEAKEGHIPNSFYFVTPVDEVKPEEVPDYAGLYYYRAFNCKSRGQVIEFYIVKQAELLHEREATIQEQMKLLQSIYFKFWRVRAGINTRIKK